MKFLVWWGLGFIGAGFTYSSWQQDAEGANRCSDICLALLMSLGGPFSLVAGIIFSEFGEYGWWRSYRKRK